MEKFISVSILLPTLNETFSFIKTIEIILDECSHSDIKEFVVIVCERTEQTSLDAINEAKKLTDEAGIPMNIVYQKLPFAGGAVRDGIDYATGTHILMMAPDLETDPHTVKTFIKAAKKYPYDMITASRWLKKGSFDGYNKTKYVLNFMFQKIFSIIYWVKLTDITFGYRIAPAKLFKSIAWEEVKHPFFLETALKPIRLGVKIHEIPSNWEARQEGESQNSLLQTFKYLGIAFKARFMRKSKILKDGIKIEDVVKKV